MLLGLALACGKLGQLGVARQHYRASVDADPSHAHAWQVTNPLTHSRCMTP